MIEVGGTFLDKARERVQADYSPDAVTESMASRALGRAERFVGAIIQRQEQS